MPNTISGVGTAYTASGTGLTTLSVTPTAAGNCLVLATMLYIDTVTVASVSGGGVTTWTNLASPFVSYGGHTLDLWIGVVTTSGAATITVTGSSSYSSVTMRLMAQEFSGGGAGTIWAKDGSQSGGRTNLTSSVNETFPTLTPGGTDRCYVGRGIAEDVTSATGQTSGYTLQRYVVDPFMYNPSVSTVQTPICLQATAGASSSVAALFTATSVSTTLPTTQRLSRAALVRSYHY